MIREATLEVLAPFTANGDLNIDGVLSIHFYNPGTALATIDGNLSIPAGASLVVASPIPDVVISSRHMVAFGAGTARLQVAVLRMKGTPYSNYEHKQQH